MGLTYHIHGSLHYEVLLSRWQCGIAKGKVVHHVQVSSYVPMRQKDTYNNSKGSIRSTSKSSVNGMLSMSVPPYPATSTFINITNCTSNIVWSSA